MVIKMGILLILNSPGNFSNHACGIIIDDLVWTFTSDNCGIGDRL